VKHALFLEHVIRPGLDVLSDAASVPMRSPAVETLMLAIAIQESALRHREQIGGPARGWWQFERNGGLAGVLQHARTKLFAERLCAEIGLKPDLHLLWDALPHSELLQAGLARLLLWSDPRPLPALGDREGAWQYYLRNWRPGKPAHGRWDAAYDGAAELVRIDAPTPETRTADALRIVTHMEASLGALRKVLR
jgi:hypothetical protein